MVEEERMEQSPKNTSNAAGRGGSTHLDPRRLGPGPRWWRELAGWPDERQELWAEQAVIMEIQGGLTRDAAEQEAYAMLTADESRRTIVAVWWRSL
jgi:hypothetical protein